MAKEQTKNQRFSFRLSSDIVELIDLYTSTYNVSKTEAVEALMRLGSGYFLSNLYADKSPD